MRGAGAHETWTVEQHFAWHAAPTAPTTNDLTNFTSPLAKRGAVLCGLKLVPLNTDISGPAEKTKGARARQAAFRTAFRGAEAVQSRARVCA